MSLQLDFYNFTLLLRHLYKLHQLPETTETHHNTDDVFFFVIMCLFYRTNDIIEHR